MSVIGIDFGNDSSVVSIARRGGIDVVANEVSKRETPSIVSYGEKERSIGEAGLSIAISNFKNTITQFKRFIGLKFNSKEVQDELKLNSFKAREHKETGGVEFEVNYREEVHYFTPEMVVATLLQKLKAFAELENGNVKIVDCVVSVPAYFTESQRRALLNATQIAGLNCLRLFNETTAAALNYGIFKQDFPEKEATHVCFVDVGQSATTISMVAFQQRQLKVLSHVFDRDLGARNLDYILADYFVEEIKKKYKMDVTTNPKALLRLRSSCEKVKKILSANSQASLNIECLMNDKDISFMIDRPAFEQLGQSLIPRFEDLVKKAYETSGLTSEKVSSVEVIGGGMRIPMIKEALEKAFGKKVVSTLNTSEAISRGCAIQGAMLSPNFRVKEFTVNDSLPFTINIGWKSASDSDAMDTDVSGISINKKVQMFKANDPFPSTKLLKFSRNEDFEIYAFYDSSENLTKDTDLLIGKFNLTKVPKKADTSLIKVKVKQNIHGLVQIESAQVVEETEVEVPATTPTPAAAAQPTTTPTQGEQAASPTAQPTEAAAAAPTTQKKVIKNHIDLVVNSTVSEMSSNGLRKALEEELQMQLQDRIVAETAERKNALESYIYDTRNKISDGGELFEYVSSSERDSLNELMNTNENWLYGDGYDSTKSAYQDRLTEMKKITDPALVRKTEEAVRSSVVDSLRQSLKNALNLSQSADEKYNHIEKSEKDSIANKCNEIENWLKNLETKQSSLPKHSQPVLFAADIKKKKIEIDEFSSKIMSKPKPKPPAPKPEEQKKPEEQQQQQQNNQQPPQQPEQNNQTTTDQTKMDLD